jgi:molecular chaperone DnaJ
MNNLLRFNYGRRFIQYHPDIYQGDKKEAEEKFKKIAEAYKILSDPEQRRKYDVYGYEGIRSNAYNSENFEGFGFNDIFSSFSDIFDDFFDFGFGTGGTKRSKNKIHGDDIKIDITIDFEESIKDTIHQIEIIRKEPCDVCHGEGIKPGTSKKVCRTCGGKGKIRNSQGFFSIVTTCPDCYGEGRVADELCKECGGKKLINQKRKIDIKIPAGIYDNSYLKLKGEGHSGIGGGMNGDLYVVIHVKPHEFFIRENNDCILFLPLKLTQAILGDKIEIPTLYGTQEIEIKPGTQNNDEMIIKGKGFPILNSNQRGDLKIYFKIEIPKNINQKFKELVKSLKDLEVEDNYPEVKKIMKKFKIKR